MIFGRGKKKAVTPDSPEEVEPADLEAEEETTTSRRARATAPEPTSAADEVEADDDLDEDDAEEDADGDELDDEEPGDDSDDDAEDWDEFEASADWREDGPFDIDEVDLEGDDVARLDLGALVVTPEEGMQLQIVANAETNEGMALVVALEQSALQLELRAAPASPGFAKEIRGDFEAETVAAGGTSQMAKGPFGIELRRVVPATDAEGNEGYAPFRDWFAEGPRWLLMGRLMGEAALDTEGEGAAAVFEEVFANLIVRRGDEAMAPGQIVPLTIPQG